MRGEGGGVDDAGAGRASAHRRVQRARRRDGGARLDAFDILLLLLLLLLLLREKAPRLGAVAQFAEKRRGESRERQIQRAPPRVTPPVADEGGDVSVAERKRRAGPGAGYRGLREARQDTLREREEHVRAAVFVFVFININSESPGRASRGDERHELGPGAGDVRVRGVLLRAGVERASLANRALHGEFVRVARTVWETRLAHPPRVFQEPRAQRGDAHHGVAARRHLEAPALVDRSAVRQQRVHAQPRSRGARLVG